MNLLFEDLLVLRETENQEPKGREEKGMATFGFDKITPTLCLSEDLLPGFL